MTLVQAGEVARPGQEFFDRARQRLTLDVPAALSDLSAPARRGDLDLDPATWERAGVKATRQAAVLIPVVDRAEPTVILTVRTPDLASHAGQIAFPGGKIDPHDATPAGGGVARGGGGDRPRCRRCVEPLGYLDLYLTFSGFRILPTVARVDPDYTMTLNRHEVVEAFEVPLAFLMAPENHQRHSRDWKGASSGNITRCRTGTGISGASPRASCAISMSASTGSECGAAPRYSCAVLDSPTRRRMAELNAMIRPIFTELALFITPFVLYALFVWATHEGVLDVNAWSVPRLIWLTISALVLVIISFLLLAQFGGAPPGSTYIPAHMENGRLVPGTER